jgi:uncharacterized protein YgbK (DUF1537 family)
MARIAIIADDLTGALDSASPFACRGLQVRVALAPEFLAEAMAARPDVVGVSTNSRALPEDRAAASALEAAERLRPWRPELVLKKVDSRLKGNIAGETAAVAGVFGSSRICTAVAVPGEGRMVRNGEVVGRGVEGHLRVAERMPSGPHVVAVLDAASDDDLDRIAADWRVGDGTLFVCARGLATAFARRVGRRGSPAAAFAAKPPVVVAVGSRDPITRKQLAMLLAATPDAGLVEAPGGRLSANHDSGPLMVFACSGDMAELPDRVAGIFAEHVAAEVERIRPATLLTTGGDTTFAVLRALGVRTLQLRGEAAGGLPWFEIRRADGGTIAAVSKSGGFGSPGVLLELLAPPGSLSPHGCDIRAGECPDSELRCSSDANFGIGTLVWWI